MTPDRYTLALQDAARVAKMMPYELIDGVETRPSCSATAAAIMALVPPPPEPQVPQVTLDQVHRFMASNPLTSWEALVSVLKLGDEDQAAVSGGRFRELWKLNGGAVDKNGRAWVEMETLPIVLRKIVDSIQRHSTPATTGAAEVTVDDLAYSIACDTYPFYKMGRLEFDEDKARKGTYAWCAVKAAQAIKKAFAGRVL